MNETLPQPLLKGLEVAEGFDRQSFEDAHINALPVTSIRFNKDKLDKFSSHDQSLHPQFNLSEPVPWCAYSFYIHERPSFTFDPLLHAGAYYVQEASSMFLYEVLQQTCTNDTNKKVLDLCAAPGGKSTLLASYFKNGLIVSNEVIQQRVNILYENLVKWGTPNIVIANNDAAAFKKLDGYFDLVIVDAPCSGSGLFRKDKDAINEWSANNVMLCSERQQRILADAYPALKQDGILIYSTCSYSKEEDENNLDWLHDNFHMESIQLQLKNEWNIVEAQSAKYKAFGYRFWPDKVNGEGFFIAALKKKDSALPVQPVLKNALNKTSNKQTSIVLNYIDEDDWFYFNHKEDIKVVSSKWANDIALLQKNLHVRKAGINAGTIIKDELIAHHELALSTIIKNSVIRIELTKEQALQYLRKQNPENLKNDGNFQGRLLSTYLNYPLGWLKFLHNRVNNYYPTNWRILKN